MRETGPKIQRLEEELSRSQRESDHMRQLLEKEKEHSHQLIGDIQNSHGHMKRL